GILRRPCVGSGYFPEYHCDPEDGVCLQYSYFRTLSARYMHIYVTNLFRIGNINSCIELTVCLGVDSNAFDICVGFYFEVYRTENTPEHPIICIPLRLIHTLVVRMLLYKNLQRIDAPV